MEHIYNPISPFQLNDKALTLSILHGTDFNYELERQARERGRADWNDLVERLPKHKSDAIRLFQEVMIPHERKWVIKPDVNLLAEDRVPNKEEERDRYFSAIIRMNKDTCAFTYGPVGNDKFNLHFLIGIALLEAEIAAADAEGRRREIANCAFEAKKLNNGSSDGLYENLQKLHSALMPSCPRPSLLLERVLDAGQEEAARAVRYSEDSFWLLESSQRYTPANENA